MSELEKRIQQIVRFDDEDVEEVNHVLDSYMREVSHPEKRTTV